MIALLLCTQFLSLIGEPKRGVVSLDRQGSQDRGRDPQGGFSRCGGPHDGHSKTRVSPVHLAGRTSSITALWTTWIWQDYDSVLGSQNTARYGGRFIGGEIVLFCIFFIDFQKKKSPHFPLPLLLFCFVFVLFFSLILFLSSQFFGYCC